MDQIRRIIKNGSSDSIVIPREMMDALLLVRGDRVLLRVEDGVLIVQKLDLSHMMRRFRPSLPREAVEAKE
jgi:antitoxin component of MazEF toxin-antitoxin module